MQENLQNSNTLPQIIAGNAAKYGDTKTAIRDKAYGIWQKYSWADYYQLPGEDCGRICCPGT